MCHTYEICMKIQLCDMKIIQLNTYGYNKL